MAPWRALPSLAEAKSPRAPAAEVRVTMSADVIATLLHHVGRGLSTLLDVVQARSLWVLRWIHQVPPLLTSR